MLDLPSIKAITLIPLANVSGMRAFCAGKLRSLKEKEWLMKELRWWSCSNLVILG